jgi:hypothetical protein
MIRRAGPKRARCWRRSRGSSFSLGGDRLSLGRAAPWNKVQNALVRAASIEEDDGKEKAPPLPQGIFASPPLLPAATHPTFLADFTTFAGDSADGHPIVVGIVVAQNHQDVRTESVHEERLTHYSLGLGTILHGQYVRDTIEAAAKQNEP